MIVERSRVTKERLPDSLQDAPQLYVGLEIYYEAFLALTTCRALGHGAQGPISWLTIAEYADRNDFEGEQREDLFYFIAHMDKAYLDFQIKRMEARGKQVAPPAAKGKKAPTRVVRPEKQVKRP
jgi:hypothetical protein